MSNKPEGHPVFISYARGDMESARELVRSLDAAGVKSWLDVAEIQPGERWASRIQEELREARVMVVMLTPDSLKSQWTFFEVGAAVADGKTIIPVLSKDVEPKDVPPILRNFQWIQGSTPGETGALIAKAVARAASHG